MFIVAPIRTLKECTQMYVNVRLHTTVYNILRHDVQQCTAMFDNVRQKLLPYDRIFVAPKSFTCKTFFLIRSIAYENLRLTANNRDKSRQHTKNCDFLIRTLSHLKIRMWETSIKRGKREYESVLAALHYVSTGKEKESVIRMQISFFKILPITH